MQFKWDSTLMEQIIYEIHIDIVNIIITHNECVYSIYFPSILFTCVINVAIHYNIII